MAVEDLLLNIGTNVSGESELDSLAGKLETIDVLEDTVDPIEIDVEVDGAKQAIGEITALETAIDGINDDLDRNLTDIFGDVDFSNIFGATDSDGGMGDGGTGGDGPLSIPQTSALRDVLGDEFDPRGLLRDDLSVEELRTGDMDEPIFQLPDEGDANDLISRDRDLRGVEELINWGDVQDSLDADGIEGIVGRSDQQLVDFPERDSESDLMDRLLGGRRGVDAERRGGMLRPFDSLQMSQFYNAMAQLLPLLFVFIGALPAAIAALGALATAAFGAAAGLAGVVGLGALGVAAARGDGDIAAGMEEIMSTIREDFLAAFLPLAKRFDDLFIDGLGGIGELFDAIAARGDTLVQFKDDVRALGEFSLNFIPKAIDLLVRLGDAFGPVFGMFGEWLNMNFDDILGGLASVFSRALPSLLRFIDAFIGFLPFLIDLSIGFLMIASYIMQFIGAIGQLLNALGPVGTGLGIIAGLLLTIGTITTVVSTLMGGVMVGAIAAAVKGLSAYIAGMFGASASTLSLAASLGILTGGLLLLAGALGMVASGFDDMMSNVGSIDSLGQFSAGGMGGMSGMSGNTSGLERGSMSVYNDNSTTVYNSTDQENQRREQRRNNYRERMFSPYQGQ